LAAVARFYLNIRNGTGFVPDPEGQEVADLAAARAKAIEGIRSVLSEEARQGTLDLAGTIEITDEDGTILLIVPFNEAVELRTAETKA
jgi:hypothetical protein